MDVLAGTETGISGVQVRRGQAVRKVPRPLAVQTAPTIEVDLDAPARPAVRLDRPAWPRRLGDAFGGVRVGDVDGLQALVGPALSRPAPLAAALRP